MRPNDLSQNHKYGNSLRGKYAFLLRLFGNRKRRKSPLLKENSRLSKETVASRNKRSASKELQENIGSVNRGAWLGRAASKETGLASEGGAFS